MPTKDELIAYVEKSPHPEVRVAACDIDGILRGKRIAKEKFLSSLEKGFGFCDVVFGWDSADVLYDNATLTGWHTGYPDLLTKLDPNTFRKIPWEENRAFVLGDFYLKNGDAHPACPRNLLKKIIEKYHKAGLDPFCSVEYEFFLFDETPHSLHEKGFQNLKPSSPGMFGYSILRSSARSDFITTLVRQMKEFDCPIEGIHTETGPGVMEAALLYTKALDAADRAALFKTAVKELAYKDGKVATFMAKWNDQLPGCGGHTHISLWKNGTNAFADEKSKSGMSPLFENFLAGVLHGLHDFMAFYCPTVNSYKRSVPGVWSPLNATWGLENRTTALRVILGQDPKSTRVEQRTPGADLNPYIAMAATLAAGLYGIEKKMPLIPGVKGSAYDLSKKEYPLLPRSLAEATERLKRSEIAREVLGEAFVDHYVKTREWEVREYNKAVTNWELKRYFEII
ncbi:MAG: glutamine synthetase [Deltaproteobacteria bacterium]|nr:glutamine synthetase [Deltaproteobacteria bacterium]